MAEIVGLDYTCATQKESRFPVAEIYWLKVVGMRKLLNKNSSRLLEVENYIDLKVMKGIVKMELSHILHQKPISDFLSLF